MSRRIIAFLPPFTLPQQKEFHRLDLLLFFQIYFILKSVNSAIFFSAVTKVYMYRSKDKEAGGYQEEKTNFT